MPGARWILLLTSVLALAACGNRFSSSGGGATSPNVDIPDLPDPPDADSTASGFPGVGQLTPRLDGFQVDWNPVQMDGAISTDFVYDVFIATGTAPLDYSSPSLTTSPAAATVTVDGLALGTSYTVGVRAVSLTDPTDVDLNCVVLSGEVARLWYVDVTAAAGGDGLGPGTAFQKITDAIVAIVGSAVPGNILVAGGTYVEQLAVLGNMHLYGAYDSGFTVRDRSQNPTVLRPAAGGTVALRILASGSPTFVDGVEISGGGAVDNGVDVRNADLQISNCSVSSVTAEGVTGSSSQRASLLRLNRVLVTGCGLEGLQAAGSYRAELIASQFTLNGTEGTEFDDLSVQKKGLTRLWVRDCEFLGNGDDGLDVDLDELDPLIGGTSREGIMEILIERSCFLDNQDWGLLLDIDFQDADKIEADLVVLDNLVSRNSRDGILLDADSLSLFVLRGNRTSANRERGLSITSDGSAATLHVSNHWAIGSGLEGVGVTGPGFVFGSHLAVTGSFLNTVTGNGSTVLGNGALWAADPPTGTDVHFSFADPLISGNGNFTGLPELNVAPIDVFFLTRRGTTTSFPIPPGATVQVGDTVELDDDGVARQVIAVNGGTAQFDPPAATSPLSLTAVSRFPGMSVDEDARLIPGSTWIDAGDPNELDADGTITDVGVLGGGLEGFAPEWTGRWRPLVVDELSPGPGAVAGPISQIDLGLTEDVDPATVNGVSVVVLLNGSVAPGNLTTPSGDIRFVPNVPMAGGTVEVHVTGAIQDLLGNPLTLPLRYQVDVP